MEGMKSNQHRKWLTLISTFVLFAFLNLVVGCKYYYEVSTETNVPSDKYLEMVQQQKYMILHDQSHVWHLKNIRIKDNTFLHGDLNVLPPEHMKYKETDPNDKTNRYMSYEGSILDEVHIYASNLVISNDNKVVIPLVSVDKIEIYDKNTGATTASWFFGFIGGTVLTLAVISIIIALTKSSCPFIYSKNGSEYIFEGEIYSGAINAPMERHDYLTLNNINDTSSLYQMKMTNEVQEIQSTNQLELMVIDHPMNSDVIFDKYGVLHTLDDPLLPNIGINLSGNNILEQISGKDSLFYTGEISDEPKELKDGLILEFANIPNDKPCKLILRAKNSYWLDYIYGQFLDLFGKKYQKWNNYQNHANREELQEWSLNQGIPISVYLFRNGEWEFIDYFNVIGPMAFKDDVLPIDLSGMDSNTLKIKLEWGHMFWEVDYVGVDYSADQKLDQKVIIPSSAIDQNGENVLQQLLNDDKEYQVLKEVGHHVFVDFKLPKKNDKLKRSYILHSKGYYEIIRNPQGKPARRYLKTFEEPTQFNKFSRDRLTQLEEQLSQ